jgi:hypothetical protein
VPGIGIVENKKEGEFVGANNGRQRLIGFAADLHGSAATDFDVEYRVRLKGVATLQAAKNGVFCGTNAKNGKTIEAISVRLRKKTP